MMQPPPPAATQVFLSYSRDNLAAAQRLGAALEENGVHVSTEYSGNLPVERLRERLDQALAQASAVVVLVGRNGMTQFMVTEVLRALELHSAAQEEEPRLPVLPLLLDQARAEDLPQFLAGARAIRWSPADPVPAALLDALRQAPRKSGTGKRRILLPDLAWVEIPAGEFIYQGTEKRSLPTFYMARYPITNVQYQSFVDAGGYQDERWWKDIGRLEPQPSGWPQANRPRTNVSWYEAVAFCRWLSAQLGYEVRLPTEQEWERAAAGNSGRSYPWGDEYLSGYANIAETVAKAGPWNLGQTTAVGLYPQGGSQEGVLDLAGNVWEWCANKDGKPEVTEADTSGDWRVLRGGSWSDLAGYARASDRFRDPPDERYDFHGFRVVSSAPIV